MMNFTFPLFFLSGVAAVPLKIFYLLCLSSSYCSLSSVYFLESSSSFLPLNPKIITISNNTFTNLASGNAFEHIGIHGFWFYIGKGEFFLSSQVHKNAITTISMLKVRCVIFVCFPKAFNLLSISFLVGNV